MAGIRDPGQIGGRPKASELNEIAPAADRLPGDEERAHRAGSEGQLGTQRLNKHITARCADQKPHVSYAAPANRQASNPLELVLRHFQPPRNKASSEYCGKPPGFAAVSAITAASAAGDGRACASTRPHHHAKSNQAPYQSHLTGRASNRSGLENEHRDRSGHGAKSWVDPSVRLLESNPSAALNLSPASSSAPANLGNDHRSRKASMP